MNQTYISRDNDGENISFVQVYWFKLSGSFTIKVIMSFTNRIDIPQIVKIYRALDGASDSRISKFIKELEPHHVKWIICKYLKQFLPYYKHNTDKRSKRGVSSPEIDYVHCQNLRSIESNNHDCSIFEIMNKTLVNKCFSKMNNTSNPLSINTRNTSSNKCLLLKLIPKNLLSYTLSYLNYYERVTASHVSYCLYDASNEPIAKHDLNYLPKWCKLRINSISM